MRWIVQKSKLSGNIAPPPSKSHTMRALLFGMMGKQKSTIHNFLQNSPDVNSMINAVKALGAKVKIKKDVLEIYRHSVLPNENFIDAKNSGQVMRFMAAIAALFPTYTFLTGDHSIKNNRPIKPLLKGLAQLGAFATSANNNNHPPIIVKGPLTPEKKITLDGEDSQPVSALIMASSFLDGTTEIFVKNPKEQPWIDLTLYWLDKLGKKYENNNYSHYTVFGNTQNKNFETTIPADFSSAAYPIAASIITQSYLTIENIDMEDVQGDKKIIDVFMKMGANIEVLENRLIIKPTPHLQGIEININDCIDAITILSVVACFATTPTHIFNGAIARKKECDRIACITKELKKMNAKIEEKPDGLIIYPSKLHGASLESHNDHRMALSLAIAGLGSIGKTFINNASCVSKSYFSFLEDFRNIKADIRSEE